MKDGYYEESPVDDPTGAATGSGRVIRGGGWYNPAGNCRSAYRYGGVPGTGTTTWACVSPEFRRTSRASGAGAQPAEHVRDVPISGRPWSHPNLCPRHGHVPPDLPINPRIADSALAFACGMFWPRRPRAPRAAAIRP